MIEISSSWQGLCVAKGKRSSSLPITLLLLPTCLEKAGGSQTREGAGSDTDSEVSDVEEQGYCDDSRSDPELRMRLKQVGKHKMEDLYKNTDAVSILKHFIHVSS